MFNLRVKSSQCRALDPHTCKWFTPTTWSIYSILHRAGHGSITLFRVSLMMTIMRFGIGSYLKWKCLIAAAAAQWDKDRLINESTSQSGRSMGACTRRFIRQRNWNISCLHCEKPLGWKLWRWSGCFIFAGWVMAGRRGRVCWQVKTAWDSILDRKEKRERMEGTGLATDVWYTHKSARQVSQSLTRGAGQWYCRSEQNRPKFY